jgi:hypothetical protein
VSVGIVTSGPSGAGGGRGGIRRKSELGDALAGRLQELRHTRGYSDGTALTIDEEKRYRSRTSDPGSAVGRTPG